MHQPRLGCIAWRLMVIAATFNDAQRFLMSVGVSRTAILEHLVRRRAAADRAHCQRPRNYARAYLLGDVGRGQQLARPCAASPSAGASATFRAKSAYGQVEQGSGCGVNRWCVLPNPLIYLRQLLWLQRQPQQQEPLPVLAAVALCTEGSISAAGPHGSTTDMVAQPAQQRSFDKDGEFEDEWFCWAHCRCDLPSTHDGELTKLEHWDPEPQPQPHLDWDDGDADDDDEDDEDDLYDQEMMFAPLAHMGLALFAHGGACLHSHYTLQLGLVAWPKLQVPCTLRLCSGDNISNSRMHGTISSDSSGSGGISSSSSSNINSNGGSRRLQWQQQHAQRSTTTRFQATARALLPVLCVP